MAKQIDSKNAKSIIKTHKSLLEQLKNVYTKHISMVQDVNAAVDRLTAQQVTEILSGIQVEEINRSKRGFRVKPLRDSGYCTIADLYKVSVSKLATVNGISDEAAVEIKKVVDEIVLTSKSSVKIRLSVDDKNPDSTALVKALSKYKRYNPFSKACYKLYNDNSSTIDKALSELKVATGSLKWIFASSSKKIKAQNAYNTLSQMLNGEYYAEAITNLDGLKGIKVRTVDEWKDFSDNSVEFFNILEDIRPGVLGTDDGMYGLPEDLALEIQKQEFLADGLKCQLRRYQEWGVKYALKQKRVLLGDEMGLGKTIQAIAAMVSLRNSGETHFVVVCPASVLSNWCREIAKMSDLNVVKVHGASKYEGFNKWVNDGGVAVTTFETTGLFQFNDSFKYSMLVIDEAHYIKNPKAKRTVNVKNICDNADRILFMTGTALENKVEEMIGLIDILKPEIASSVKGMEFLSSAPQFREKVASVYYRRKREDVLTELPELIETKEWCVLGSEEEAVYEDSILNGSFADARRVSWNVDDIKYSSKATRMKELIEEAQEDGRKVIVFSFFLDTIDKVMSMLKDKCIGPINGSVPPQKRQEIVDEFNNAPAGSVLVAQIQSGGTGLNIQSASVVILCEPQFKPSIENQAISRAYRMGQTRNVLVYRLLCDDTVDERITELLETKQTIFDAFADESVAADKSFELDEKSFSNIVKEEAQRITAKRGEVSPVQNVDSSARVTNDKE